MLPEKIYILTNVTPYHKTVASTSRAVFFTIYTLSKNCGDIYNYLRNTNYSP